MVYIKKISCVGVWFGMLVGGIIGITFRDILIGILGFIIAYIIGYIIQLFADRKDSFIYERRFM